MQNTNPNEKENLKPYALTSMQTNNQNEKHENYRCPVLKSSIIIQRKESKRRETKETISPGQMLSAPKLCIFVITEAHGASAIPLQCQDLAL